MRSKGSNGPAVSVKWKKVKRSSRFRQAEKGQACQQFPPSGKAQTAQPFPSTGNGQTKLFVAAVRPLFEVIFPDQSGVTVVYFETPLGLLIRKWVKHIPQRASRITTSTCVQFSFQSAIMKTWRWKLQLFQPQCVCPEPPSLLQRVFFWW